MNLEEMGKSLGLVTPWEKMWAGQTFPGLCPAWNLPLAGLMSRFPAVYFGQVWKTRMWIVLQVNTSASFPLAVENLLVCLNLENPKAEVPFLVKNPFLKSEAWGFSWLASRLASCLLPRRLWTERRDYLESLTRNNVFLGYIWRSTDIWCPIMQPH